MIMRERERKNIKHWHISTTDKRHTTSEHANKSLYGGSDHGASNSELMENMYLHLLWLSEGR